MEKSPRSTRERGLSESAAERAYFVIGMHIIIGMPPHIIIIGAPMAIIAFMASQRSVMRAIIVGSAGIIFIIMPSFVISQDILHMMGIIPPIIIGIIMPPIGMPMPMPIGIMPFIIMGIMFMPPIIGICIGMFDIGIIGPFIIGIELIAFMASSIGSSRPASSFAGPP